MFARFDENPAVSLQDSKETKRYGRTDAWTDGRTNNVKTALTLQDIKETKRYRQTDARTDNVKTVYPPQTKFGGGGIKTKFAWGIITCLFHRSGQSNSIYMYMVGNLKHTYYLIKIFLSQLCVVVVFVFNVTPTVKVI